MQGEVQYIQRGLMLHFRESSIRCYLTHIPSCFSSPLPLYFGAKLCRVAGQLQALTFSIPLILLPSPSSVHILILLLCSGFRRGAQSALFLSLSLSSHTGLQNLPPGTSSTPPVLSPQDETLRNCKMSRGNPHDPGTHTKERLNTTAAQREHVTLWSDAKCIHSKEFFNAFRSPLHRAVRTGCLLAVIKRKSTVNLLSIVAIPVNPTETTWLPSSRRGLLFNWKASNDGR